MVHTLPAQLPASDGALFGALHQMFGIGEWDECTTPYWRFRQVEAAKVKRSRAKHDASIAEVYVAGLYCQAHGITVLGVTWLYAHIGAAWKWWDSHESGTGYLDIDYAAAIREEMRVSGWGPNASPWLERLLRAAPQYRAEVLDEYDARDKERA